MRAEITSNTTYLSFLDNGQGDGIAGDGFQNGTERTVYTGQLRPGVTLTNKPFGLGAGDTTFNSRLSPVLLVQSY
jgi:hypothetical protein